MKSDPENIVLIRTDRIGEVLLSTSAVDMVKNRYPSAQITFVTSEYARPLVEDRKDLKEILTADTFTRRGWLKRAVELSRRLKAGHFDMAVVMNPHKMLHLAVFLAGIPVKVGYDRKWGFLLNRKIKDRREEGEKHEIEYTADLMKTAGFGGKIKGPRLPVDAGKKSAVEIMIKEAGIGSGKPIIAIHASSSNPSKMWPKEKFAGLIRKTKKNIDAEIALIGDKGSYEVCRDIISLSGQQRCANLCGKMDLKELAVFLSMSAVFVGNDTGPMHMAAALGVPVVAIFGRNIAGVGPKRWGPWGEGHIVFHRHDSCGKCYDEACPFEHKCLQDISADEVYDALNGIFHGRTA